MGQFASFADFIQMGKHGLYVWLSYGIALGIFLYNIAAVVLNKRQFFNEAKRRLRRERENKI
jgi:heme exporter protein D